MNQFSLGFIYVLQNEAMPNLTKIGLTSRLPEDRAKELFGTSVPFPFFVAFRALTSHPTLLEKAVHEELREFRVNANREFFCISPEDAAETILNIRKKIDGIEHWNAKTQVILRENDRLLLSMKAGQIFALSAHPHILAKEADIIDLWQAHEDGDILELYCTDRSEYISGISDGDLFSTNDPVPFLNRDGSAYNDEPYGRERLIPGDRLLWMDAMGNDFKSVLIELQSFCQVVARTRKPKFLNGFPLLFNDVTAQDPTPPMAETMQKVLSLPIPRTWRPRHLTDENQWSEFGKQEMPPEFWLQQLNKKRKI